jgi:hypothetical protein
MLAKFGDRLSARKARLFICACCRMVWHLLDEPARRVVELMERCADGLLTMEEWQEARAWTEKFLVEFPFTGASYSDEVMLIELDIGQYREVHARRTVLFSAASEIRAAARVACDSAMTALAREQREVWFGQMETSSRRIRRIAQTKQAALLRDLHRGAPMSQFSIEDSWRTATVMEMARAIYEGPESPSGELDHTRLAVLADALEEAGCTAAELPAHCRANAEHVRGCWAVDLLLGKE